MELVPEEELETSTQGGPNSLADRRARKVVLILILNTISSIISMKYNCMTQTL
jgi:hypothetical protein